MYVWFIFDQTFSEAILHSLFIWLSPLLTLKFTWKLSSAEIWLLFTISLFKPCKCSCDWQVFVATGIMFKWVMQYTTHRCIFGSATFKNCNIFAGNINHSITDQITHHLLTNLYIYHLVVRLSTRMQVCLLCGRTSETTVQKWHQSILLFMRQWKLQTEYEQPTQQQWMWGWLWVMNL